MSITAGPSQAASAFQDIARSVSAYVVAAKLAATDGLTWSEFGELLLGLMRLAIQAADVMNVPGRVKKELVLEAVASLFDSVADKAVPAVAWPIWILARPAVRQLVLALASGAIEQLLPLVRT